MKKGLIAFTLVSAISSGSVVLPSTAAFADAAADVATALQTLTGPALASAIDAALKSATSPEEVKAAIEAISAAATPAQQASLGGAVGAAVAALPEAQKSAAIEAVGSSQLDGFKSAFVVSFVSASPDATVAIATVISSVSTLSDGQQKAMGIAIGVASTQLPPSVSQAVTRAVVSSPDAGSTIKASYVAGFVNASPDKEVAVSALSTAVAASTEASAALGAAIAGAISLALVPPATAQIVTAAVQASGNQSLASSYSANATNPAANNTTPGDASSAIPEQKADTNAGSPS